MSRRAFLALASIHFGAMMAGLVLAIVMDWPALLFPGEPHSIEIEAMAEGTALSPPIWALVPYGLLIPLAARPDRLGRAATAIMVLLSLAFLGAGVWQAVGLPSPETPDGAIVTGAAAGGVLSALVALTGALSLLAPSRP